METINIVEEIIKFRTSLVETINDNPLPVTIKSMLVSEFASTLKSAEIAELNKTKQSMAKEEEQCQTTSTAT